MKIKKRFLALCLALLMLIPLCGCNMFWKLFPDYDISIFEQAFSADYNYRDKIVNFSDMEYVRPDVDKMKVLADEITEMVSDTASRNEITQKLDEFYELYFNFTTMEAIAGIRNDIDMTDKFYSEEYDYCTSAEATVDRMVDDMQCACSNSSICAYLDAQYFGGMLAENYSVDGEFGYTDTLIELFNKESSLQADYRALMAEMSGYDGDDAYKKFNERACNIYIDLVKTRKAIAKEYNLDSYEDYMSMVYSRDYSDAELTPYIDAIKKYLVPLYKSAVDSGMINDMYDGLNELSTDKAVECFDSFVSKLPEQISQTRDFMKQYGLYNISSDDNSSDSSYNTYLDQYDAPFMMIKTEGYGEDMLTIVHEFGHFCDAYANYNNDTNLDTEEVMSQGLEYLLLCYLDDANFADSLTRYKMLDELYLYVNQASFYDFEKRVFALSDDELTVDKVNGIFGDVAKEYGYYDDSTTSVSWIDVTHFFDYPFYVISYCVSDSAAFSIYNMELKETGAGVNMYLKLLDNADNYGFVELLKSEGMKSPVTSETIFEISEMLSERLGL